MLPTIEEYGFYLAALVVAVMFGLSLRRPGMSNAGRTALSVGCSVMLVCANFVDRASGLNDQIYLLGIAGEVFLMTWQLWRGSRMTGPVITEVKPLYSVDRSVRELVHDQAAS